MIAGSSAIARAIAARFCMPPLSSAGERCTADIRPTRYSFVRATRSIASSSNSVNSSSGSRTFSSVLIEPNKAPIWYITPNLRMIERRAGPSAVTMSSPSIAMRPRSGCCRPIMCFSSVLLPQPEPPRITNTSPRRTSKVTFSSNMKSPYPAVRPST